MAADSSVSAQPAEGTTAESLANGVVAKAPTPAEPAKSQEEAAPAAPAALPPDNSTRPPAQNGSTLEQTALSKIDNMARTLNKIEKASTDGKQKTKPMEAFASTIPQIRQCNSWDEFKNHHSKDEHRHAIETLVAGESLKTEMEEAAAQGAGEDLLFPGRYGGYGKFRGRLGWKQTVVDDRDEAWLQQVRINSKIIMSYLGRRSAAGKRWKGRPHVFLRPFRYFIYFHAEMKAELAELERATAISSPKGDDYDAVGGLQAAAPDSLGLEKLFDAGEAEAELAELRLYIQFVDDHIMPDYNRFSGNAGPDMPTRIRWDDLWYLFQPNDIIYAAPGSAHRSDPAWSAMDDLAGLLQNAVRGALSHGEGGADLGASSNATRGSHMDQMLWKVYRPPYRSSGEGCDCAECLRRDGTCRILCYYIDHGGQGYQAVERAININPFPGERDITQLPCYPIRYVKNSDEVMKSGRLNGQKFLHYTNPAEKYAFYRGWTVIRKPSGRPIKDEGGRLSTSPEHIESEVIVDFEEAFNTNPSWRPEIISLDEVTHDVQVSFDADCPLCEWSDKRRTELVEKWEDRFVYDDGVEILQQNAFRKTDPLLNPDQSPGFGQLIQDGDNDMLVLLPRRVLAYALWERKFIQIDVREIQAPAFDDKEKAFKNLEIPPKHKTLIESLVYSHFQRRTTESHVELGSLDIIRGKGKGIVILLFGVPGVGKTATAEAVAQKFKKPLFPITCGDIGFTPQSVENSLREIFRLAHLWDCVLLLDEADVFITQRNKTDLERNALVSVFLRMLEYYNGILFLTTNRPGVLDEAVKSRVHLNLRYHSLTELQVVSIFKINIARLHDMEEKASQTPTYKRLEIDEDDILEFASDHWHQNEDGLGRWNGRQIRNAFLIASSLAHYESDFAKRPGPKILTSKHFKQVQDTTKRYDEYRMAVLGQTDGVIAYDRAERDDEWMPLAQHRPQNEMYSQREAQSYMAPPNHPQRRESTSMHRPGPEGKSSGNAGTSANLYGTSIGLGGAAARGGYSAGAGGGRMGLGPRLYTGRNTSTGASGSGGVYDEGLARPGSPRSRRGPEEEEVNYNWNGGGYQNAIHRGWDSYEANV